VLTHILTPSIVANTLIKTPQGLVQVEIIKVGDTLIGYKQNKALTTVKITSISSSIVNKTVIITTNKGVLRAPPDQLFYDPITQQWIPAKNVTHNTILFDAHLNHCTCIDTKTVPTKPIKVYHISTTSPHNFFITDQEILTHNFFPAVAISISWLFGLGSVEFAGIGTTILGTGIAIKLFKNRKKNKTKITITPITGGSASNFSPDPDDDDKKSGKNKKRKHNIITKPEFFKKVKKDYKRWKKNIYIRKHKAKGIENAEYLEWDYKHNDAEAYSRSKKHLGSIDPETLKLYKNAIPDRELSNC